MSDDTAAGTTELAYSERSADDQRRLGLVVGVAFAGLAVLGLAWTVTPTGISSAALGVGAVGVLSLAGLGLVSAHQRVHEHLQVHAEAIDAAHGIPSASEEEIGELMERVDVLEDRVATVERQQTEQIVELIESTDAPATGAETETPKQG